MNQSRANKSSSADCPYATRNNNKETKVTTYPEDTIITGIICTVCLKRARPLHTIFFCIFFVLYF